MLKPSIHINSGPDTFHGGTGYRCMGLPWLGPGEFDDAENSKGNSIAGGCIPGRKLRKPERSGQNFLQISMDWWREIYPNPGFLFLKIYRD